MRLVRRIISVSVRRLGRLRLGLLVLTMAMLGFLAGAQTATAAVAATVATVSPAASSGSTPQPTAMEDMPGMDHGDMPGMDHSAGSSDMPSMDHSHGSTDMPGMDHSEHGGTVDPTPDRPLGLVLGSFGTASAGVLASAALMRRRDNASHSARRTHTAARKARS